MSNQELDQKIYQFIATTPGYVKSATIEGTLKPQGYDTVNKALKRLKRAGAIEFRRGRGAGWIALTCALTMMACGGVPNRERTPASCDVCVR